MRELFVPLRGVAGLTVAATLAVGIPAHASTRSPTAVAAPAVKPKFGASDAESALIMANQPGLDKAVARIRAAGANAPTGTGIGGVEVDAAHNSMTLYWHGAIGSAVSTEIAADRAAGQTVTVKVSPYTEAELVAEAKRVSMAQSSVSTVKGTAAITLAGAGPAVDGGGLDLGVVTVPNGVPQNTRIPVDSLPSSLKAITSKYPVSIAQTPFSVPSADYVGSPSLNRNVGGPGVDTMAGTFMTRADGTKCSAGFGVYFLNTGNDGVLTAGHCAWDNWYDNYTGNSIGRTVGLSYSYDAQVISAYSLAEVWLGSDWTYNNGQYADPVVGVAGNSVGDWICMSGAVTGYVCDTQVYQLHYSATVDGHPASELVLARDRSCCNTQIVAQGDSGGPVFFPQSDGTIIAKGSITGIQGSTIPCQTNGAIQLGVLCGNYIAYEDILNIESTFGVRVKLV